MRLEQAFSLIRDMDAQAFSSDVTWCSINVWPLMRQSLWIELTEATELVTKNDPVNRVNTIQRSLFKRITAAASALRNRPASIGSETTAFISRPVYLQALPNGRFFDRIVDPLIFCMPGDSLVAKYYVAPWPAEVELNFPAALLRPYRLLTSSLDLPLTHRALLIRMAVDVGIEPTRLLWRYRENLKAFDIWLKAARNFFDTRKSLKTVYLPSWYFPDMMALVAAARERNIKTIEVQHGKQGRLQAMYSGWRIPKDGYQMMPDVFWNWGKPSAEHILASSPDRRIHRPIIGGFPWLDYYRQHVSRPTASDCRAVAKRVLITVQSPQGENNQPIPDFLLDFLRESARDTFFIFRCHPNDQLGPEYCRRRLSGVPADVYKIDDGHSNLYDHLMTVTHHMTAYSSCCYEASAFGVPTLLFGAESQAIYKEEIDKGLFSWTAGSATDLVLWLEEGNFDESMIDNEYITSSLENTALILRQAEYRDFDFYPSDHPREI